MHNIPLDSSSELHYTDDLSDEILHERLTKLNLGEKLNISIYGEDIQQLFSKQLPSNILRYPTDQLVDGMDVYVEYDNYRVRIMLIENDGVYSVVNVKGYVIVQNIDVVNLIWTKEETSDEYTVLVSIFDTKNIEGVCYGVDYSLPGTN